MKDIIPKILVVLLMFCILILLGYKFGYDIGQSEANGLLFENGVYKGAVMTFKYRRDIEESGLLSVDPDSIKIEYLLYLDSLVPDFYIGDEADSISKILTSYKQVKLLEGR